MKISEARLRKLIREVLSETKDSYENLQPTGLKTHIGSQLKGIAGDAIKDFAGAGIVDRIFQAGKKIDDHMYWKKFADKNPQQPILQLLSICRNFQTDFRESGNSDIVSAFNKMLKDYDVKYELVPVAGAPQDIDYHGDIDIANYASTDLQPVDIDDPNHASTNNPVLTDL